MVSDPEPAVSGSKIMKWCDWHMTDNLGRARHSVRAVLFATHAPAVRGLTALPATGLPCFWCGRARHSVRAVLFAAHAPAVRGLTALPATGLPCLWCGRARHSVRAACLQRRTLVVMRLPALPALLAPVAAGRFCPIVCQRLNPKIFFILYNSSLNVCRRAGLRQFTLKSEWDGRTAKHRRSQGFPI